MSAPFQLTPQATEDLDAIWWFIEEDSREAANQVETEIIATCRRLARFPFIGLKWGSAGARFITRCGARGEKAGTAKLQEIVQLFVAVINDVLSRH
jgi:plasmid stabilization system protein ParE